MSRFDVDKEGTTAFESGNKYLVTTYIDEEPLFNQFKQYDNSDRYQFEISEYDFNLVRQTLDEFYDKVVIEDNPRGNLVTVDKKADTNRIPRNSATMEHRSCHEI